MSANYQRLDHDAIMLEARQLRARALADLMRSLINVFRRKPAQGMAKT